MDANATVDHARLRRVIDGEAVVQLKETLYKFLETEPEFRRTFGRLSLEERRELTIARVEKLRSGYYNDRLQESRLMQNLREVANGVANTDENATLAIGEILQVMAVGMYDWSTQIATGLAYLLPYSIVRGLGTEQHAQILEAITKGQVKGCLMLTELTHGTNLREIQTVARFDSEHDQFVFETPNVGALKCWSGNLASNFANHAVVFAQLEVGGVRRGVHPFLLRIRDDQNKLLPGLIVGDMGEKVGMHGLANGWAIFRHYLAPRDALLNRLADVTPSGEYVSPFASMSSNDRSGSGDGLGTVLLGALSDGRVGITAFGVGGMILALTIALRYAHARKQYPLSASKAAELGVRELPIIEFQLQQTRLLPYLAATHCWYYFIKSIFVNYMVFKMRLFETAMTIADIELIKEIHALSCAGKAQSGWLAMNIIQEARESCGGHGYLHAARLGILREDHDANLTWEGDDNVLIQQAGNYVLAMFEKRATYSPLHSIDYIGVFDYSQFETHSPNSNNDALLRKFTAANILDDSTDKYFLVEIMQLVVCYAVWKQANKVASYVRAGASKEDAKLLTQAFYSKTVGIAYIETYVLTVFYNYLNDNADKITYPSLRIHSNEYAGLLRRLFTLYACSVIEKYLGDLYESGFAHGNLLTVCRDSIVDLSALLKPDSLAVINALAPSDFIVDSVIAHSDSPTMYASVAQSLIQSSGSGVDPKALPFGLFESKL